MNLAQIKYGMHVAITPKKKDAAQLSGTVLAIDPGNQRAIVLLPRGQIVVKIARLEPVTENNGRPKKRTEPEAVPS